MTNWPEYVPVIVLDCPAARIPTAQMYMAAVPKAQPRKTPCKNAKMLMFKPQYCTKINVTDSVD